MAIIRQKIWTYVGPSPNEISLFNHPVAENFSEPSNDIKEYLIFLIRAMAIKGYVFKPSKAWQESYLFQCLSVPSMFQNETTYQGRPSSVDPKHCIDCKDDSIFDLLSESSSGTGILDILSTSEIHPDIIVYYDESGNCEYALENIYYPLVKGFNLANSDDIRKLTYLASCSNQFNISVEKSAIGHSMFCGLVYNEYEALTKSIADNTCSTITSIEQFDLFEHVFSMACATHANGRPYVLPVWLARLPNKTSYGVSSTTGDYRLAADMINKTLTRFLTTQAFVLISSIKAEKGLNLNGEDMPKIDTSVRTYIMEPDDRLPKGWTNDLKKVILRHANRTMFMHSQEALL